MRVLSRILVLVPVIIVLFLCSFLGFFAFQWIDLDIAQDLMEIVYYEEDLRALMLILVAMIMFINFIFYKVFTGSDSKEKVIAFDNPSGRVSVSLGALEEMIKRKIGRVSDIKDAKATISATRKGLLVKVKLILCSEVNIPEISSRIQNLVMRKVQDMIGMEEPVRVAVFVGKILPAKAKDKHESKIDLEEKEEVNVPFQGYRA